MTLCNTVQPGDWPGVNRNFRKLGSSMLGPDSSPDFAGLTLSGLTQGSVIFAGASGIISQDNSNLFWDDTNKRLGIGTNSPGRHLHLRKANPVFRFDDSSGTTVTDSVGFIEFGSYNPSWNRHGWIGYGSSIDDALTINNEDGSNIALMGGNVGIGTKAPETLSEWEGTAPYLTIHNSTHEDTDGGGESRLIYKREDGAGTETACFQFETSHDGSGVNDQLGKGVWSVNTGSALVEAMRLNSDIRLGIGIGSGLDPRSGLTVSGDVDILHTAVENDDHALELDVDAAAFGDVKAIDVNYITGAIVAGEDEGIILINIDEIAATGGDVFALEVLATDGSAGIYGLKVGALVGPIHQDSGTFANPTTGTDNTTSTDVAAMIDGNSGTTTSIFESNTEYILIGAAAAFEEIEFILTTGSSSAGIKPKFEYSIAGAHTFTEFSPVDGTNGFRNTGVIAWDAGDLTSHAVNTDTGTFDIKITRQRNSLSVTPILGYAKTAATTEYVWDKNGNVNINSLTLAGNLTMPNGGAIGQAAGPLLTFDDSNNFLEITGCKVGIGVVDPDSALEIFDTGTQLKLSYDATNAVTFVVSATGNLSISASGDSIGFGSENITIGGTLTFEKPSANNYMFTSRGTGVLALECQDNASVFELDLFSKAADNTQNVQLLLFPRGTPASITTSSQLRIQYKASDNTYNIWSHETNSGGLWPIHLYTTGNTNQVVVDPDGTVEIGADVFNFTGTMGNGSDDPTTDAPTDWVEVQIGGVTRYLPAYT